MSAGSAAAATSAPTASRLAVLYDGDCGLCAATARQLQRWDRHGRLELLPLQSLSTEAPPDVARLAAGRPLTSALHVVDPSTGTVSSGGDGFLAIARRLPGGAGPAALVSAVPPARWAIGLGYQIVARHRHRIGHWLRLEGPACDLPR